MKTLLSLSIVAAAFLCGCKADKSADVQTNVAPIAGKAYDAPKSAAAGNSNIPASVKNAIPGGK